MISKASFSRNLREGRKAQGATQDEFARFFGVGLKKYQGWENEKKTSAWPSTPELFMVADRLSSTPTSLCDAKSYAKKEHNYDLKIQKVLERVQGDRVFMMFCHLASAKPTQVIDAWLNLFESESIYSDAEVKGIMGGEK